MYKKHVLILYNQHVLNYYKINWYSEIEIQYMTGAH